MNTQLGLVRACLQAGCRVWLLESGATLESHGDRRPAGARRLRFGHLVAVELTSSPVIVWNWQRALALEWRDETILALLPEGRLVESRWVASLNRAPEIWVTRTAEGWEAHDDVLASGGPAHPDWLLRWWIGQAMATSAQSGPL